MDDLPDTIRLTEAEQAELARRIDEMLAERPPAPPMTDAELCDLEKRSAAQIAFPGLFDHAEGEHD